MNLLRPSRRFNKPAYLAATLAVLPFVLSAAHAQDAPPAAAPAKKMAEPPAKKADPNVNWTMLRGDAARTGIAEETLEPPLSLLWRFTAGPQVGNGCAPAVVGNTVYFASRSSAEANSGGMLYAIDTNTGAEKWRYPGNEGLPGKFLFLTAPTVQDGVVYIGASDGNMYAVDANTGKLVVRYRTTRPINSAAVIDNGSLVFGSDEGTLYNLNPQTGVPAWKQLYKSGDSINSAPVLADNLIFFTTNDNSVHAIRQSTGQFRWKLRLPFRVLPNAPVYSDGTLLVAAGQRLNAIQPSSGNLRWARDLPGDIVAAPVSQENVVYLVSRDSKGGSEVYAVRGNNGKNVWASPATLPLVPSAAPTLSGDVLYVPTTKNTLYALSKEDGSVLWEYHIDPSSNRPNYTPRPLTAISAPVTISGHTLYTLTDDGSLSAFRADAPDGTGPITEIVYPHPGQSVNGNPPLVLAATVLDPGSGLDPDSVKMTLDGKEVDAQYDANRNLVIYATRPSGKIIDPALPAGRHSATITATDWKGNVSEEEWSFVVDNSVPRPSTSSTPNAPVVKNKPTAAGKPGQTASGTNNNNNRGGRRGGRGGTVGGGRRAGGL